MLQRFLKTVKSVIGQGEDRHKRRNVETRRRFNDLIRASQGGGIIGKGSIKFVLGDEIELPCSTDEIPPMKPGMVQILMPNYIYQEELATIKLLFVPQFVLGRRGIAFEPELEQGLGGVTPGSFMCPVKDEELEFAKLRNRLWMRNHIVMAVIPRAEKLPLSIRPDHIVEMKPILGFILLDILYMLWRLDLNYIVHGDTKIHNCMIKHNRGVLIDFEMAFTYSDFLTSLSTNNIIRDLQYRISILQKNIVPELVGLCNMKSEKGKLPLPVNEIFEILSENSRYGYLLIVKRVLFSTMNFHGVTRLTEDIFFSGEKYTNPDLIAVTPPAATYSRKNFNKLKSWQEIYKGLFDFFNFTDPKINQLHRGYWNHVQKKINQK